MSAESALIRVMVAIEIAELVIDAHLFVSKALDNVPHPIMAINPIRMKFFYNMIKIGRLKKHEREFCITRLIPSL